MTFYYVKELLVGAVGLGIVICVVGDVDWFMGITRQARLGYPFGRKFARITWGIVGMVIVLFAMCGF